MQNKILKYLTDCKKRTVELNELQDLFDGKISYEEFANEVNSLINSGILKPIKNAGVTVRSPRLPYKFKTDQSKITENYKTEIQLFGFTIDSRINLSFYYSRPQRVWEADRQGILMIDKYLRLHGLPTEPAGSPERSYQIFGDEKFIDEKNGRRLLQRVGLYDELKISGECDPAMFFLNPQLFKSDCQHKHIIIENRTPFYNLVEVIGKCQFTSIIYGKGFNIISAIDLFESQTGLENNVYYYFGDLDYTGISIWYFVWKKVRALPALPFYTAMLECIAAPGKDYQYRHEESLNCFVSHFEPKYKDKILHTLEGGKYYPQEIINKLQLQDIASLFSKI